MEPSELAVVPTLIGRAQHCAPTPVPGLCEPKEIKVWEALPWEAPLRSSQMLPLGEVATASRKERTPVF